MNRNLLAGLVLGASLLCTAGGAVAGNSDMHAVSTTRMKTQPNGNPQPKSDVIFDRWGNDYRSAPANMKGDAPTGTKR